MRRTIVTLRTVTMAMGIPTVLLGPRCGFAPCTLVHVARKD